MVFEPFLFQTVDLPNSWIPPEIFVAIGAVRIHYKLSRILIVDFML